ncbi:MAG TPA: hypothetical protein VGQ31_07605, partial [Candidatus Limnocylindrales bacterium]|nr:hypothetical protein [Candidatus Limnocylindrales bacterium]
SRRTVLGSGNTEFAVVLHPAAPELILTASDSGRVTVAAGTEAVGPGYHRFVGRLLERMAIDLAINWDASGTEDADPAFETAAMTFADRPTTERAYLAWLGRMLVGVRARRAAGTHGVQLGIPPGIRYTFDGAIATVLGPRDDAWLERALADTRVATDITAWWPDATGGQSMLNRALCLMWLDVRWRTPAMPAERLLLDEVHRLLTKAFPLEPRLAYPWRAWAEVVEHLGADDAMARQVIERAIREPDDTAPIGYRRNPVTISHEGWALEIPGSFAERRTPEEWWGGGVGRSITLAAVETGTETGAMDARSFIEQFAADLGPDAIPHQAGPVLGRAALSTDATSGLEVCVLEGYSAVAGSGAAIRIVFDDVSDWQWALDTWRALAPG